MKCEVDLATLVLMLHTLKIRVLYFQNVLVLYFFSSFTPDSQMDSVPEPGSFGGFFLPTVAKQFLRGSFDYWGFLNLVLES